MSTRKFDFSDEALVPLLSEPGGLQVVILQRFDNKVYTNVPHLAVQHSPSGFEFGYAGSGPADLALNICQWAFEQLEGVKGSALRGEEAVKVWGGQTVHRAVFQMYQDFKSQFIATMPREGGEIPTETVLKWVSTRLHGYYAVKEMGDPDDGR